MKKRVFLTSIITLVVAIVICGLFAIPGQFATIRSHDYSAYEVIFYYANINGKNYLAENSPNAHASVAGIIALVFILFGIVSVIFEKKDKSLPILGGISFGISGLLFLTMNLWMAIIYKGYATLHWLTYVAGAFLLVLGAILAIFGIMYVKETGSYKKADQGYNYLKSNKKK